MQALTESFANSASQFDPTINIQKTEVMFQPAPGKRTLIHKLTSMEFHLSLYHNFAILGAHYQTMHYWMKKSLIVSVKPALHMVC